MTYAAGSPALSPHQHAVFAVDRLKALAALLSAEGVGYAVTNLDGNAASALFEIFELGLAEVQLALVEMTKKMCSTCGCACLEEV